MIKPAPPMPSTLPASFRPALCQPADLPGTRPFYVRPGSPLPTPPVLPPAAPQAAGIQPATLRACLRHLQPLGHEVSLLQQASRQLWRKLEKGRFEPALQAWLQPWSPAAPPPEALPACFTLLLTSGAQGWQLAGSSLPWLRDPAWAALLHLPALRPFWAGALRASHLQHLRQVLPQAWFLDPAPLPPGSVIAGLGVPSWAQALQLPGRSFSLHGQGPATPESLAAALGSPRSLLTEASPLFTDPAEPAAEGGEPPPAPPALLARYQHDASGIHLEAAWASGPLD